MVSPKASTFTGRRFLLAKLTLPILGEFVPRGDGTFLLRPRVPDADGEAWLTVSQAAELLALKRNQVYPLFARELLVFWRPTRGKYLISLASAQRLKRATRDPDFWDSLRLQRVIRDLVRKDMRRLTATPLHR